MLGAAQFPWFPSRDRTVAYSRFGLMSRKGFTLQPVTGPSTSKSWLASLEVVVCLSIITSHLPGNFAAFVAEAYATPRSASSRHFEIETMTWNSHGRRCLPISTWKSPVTIARRFFFFSAFARVESGRAGQCASLTNI